MFFKFDLYYCLIQIIYLYIIYLISSNNYVYIYNILSFLIIILTSILLSYKDNDFFSSLILLIETLAFLIIILFSFFNNSWIKIYYFNTKFMIILIFFIVLTYFFYFRVTSYDIFFLNIHRTVTIYSDLNILFIGSFFSSFFFFYCLLYLIFIVGTIILFIIKSINTNYHSYNNSKKKFNFRINKFQNNYKQSWRAAGVRIIR